MRTQDLYPELTASEVAEIIDPVHFGDATERRGVLDVPSFAATPDDFGPGNERYTFERVCRHIADAAIAAHPATFDTGVQDLDAFGLDLSRTLTDDIAELLIRPLADSVRPCDGVPDDLTYRTFCADLCAHGLAAFAGEFPVLWERLQVRLVGRLDALRETLDRLAADRRDLQQELGLNADAQIVSIGMAGDTHCGGRTVSVIEYDDGFKLVHKPRPVDCEAGYSRLVEELRSDLDLDLPAAKVLARTGYGYVEFVEVDDDADIDLRDVGRLGALMYALNARDMHFTNILNTARGPVPVDLETLLHPLRQKSQGTIETPDSGYQKLAVSVFGIGILPMIVTREGHDGYADVGYLGGGEVHGSGPFRQFRVEDPFSARVRVSWAPEQRTAVQALDGLDTTAAVVRHSCARMVDGFTQVYRLIAEHKAAFAAAVRRCFAGAELRYVHNATVQYAQCLRVLTASSPSRDAELAKGLIKRIGIASRGADRRLIDAECQQLWKTDIPYFLVRADSDVMTDGVERRPVAQFDRSPLAQCVAKVDAMDEHDLQAQVRLIRVAFNAKLADPHTMAPAAEVLSGAAAPEDSSGEAQLDLARYVGEGLVRDMVQDRYAHLPQTWIGPVATAVANRPWPPGVLGYDLYTGRVGPALTLAALGRALSDESMQAASLAVFEPSARILDAGSYEARSIARSGNGAYAGFPGALWAMALAGRHLDRPDLTVSAIDALEFLRPAKPGQDDGWFDLITGDVGVLLVRMALGRDCAAEAVHACDVALSTGLIQRMEYSGLAHGLAGLLQLAARTHAITTDPVAAELAAGVIDELDTVFGRGAGAPRTARTGPANESDSWCNGSAGVLIAMSSAATAGLVTADRVQSMVAGLADASIATSATLCHGALGLYGALGIAAAHAPEQARPLQDRLAGYLAPERLRRFLDSPDSRYSQGPCLMVGRAGVGWHMLSRTGHELASPLDMGEVILDA